MWTYDVDTDAWQEIAQGGDILPKLTGWGAQLITYDASVDRLVLYIYEATYEFDLRTSTWARQPDAPPSLAYSWYDTRRYSSAYDDASARTVVFNRGRVIAYDATAHEWETVQDSPLVWSSTLGVAMAYDPTNQRIVAIGGNARGEVVQVDDVAALDDVAAFDMRTRTWTELLARSRS
jgi:hypothetical protein